MVRRFWQIRGYCSSEKIFEIQVPLSYLSERQMEALLKALTAKAALTFHEIVGAYARQSSEISNDLLQVQKLKPYPEYTCGLGTTRFHAKVIENE